LNLKDLKVTEVKSSFPGVKKKNIAITKNLEWVVVISNNGDIEVSNLVNGQLVSRRPQNDSLGSVHHVINDAHSNKILIAYTRHKLVTLELIDLEDEKLKTLAMFKSPMGFVIGGFISDNSVYLYSDLFSIRKWYYEYSPPYPYDTLENFLIKIGAIVGKDKK